MKIVFISPVEDVSIPGLRALSAYLRDEGHETTLILLPWSFTDVTLSDQNSFLYQFPDKVLEQVAEICSNSDLIGVSLMSCHFDQAVHITGFLHRCLHIPVIWGGIHPTIRSAECLEYADMICVGEGEVSLSQLALEMSNGKSWKSLSVPGIHTRYDRRPLAVLPSPIIRNLDELPFLDYELEHQFILYKGNVLPLDPDLLTRCLVYSYRTLFSRGCPYACTYCCNNAIRKLYRHKLPLRWRGVDKAIEELKASIELMPQLREIDIGDDSFLSQPTRLIESFALKYRQEIGLPLRILAVPRAVSESKIKPLIEAGLYKIAIGMQSGSERTLRELYSRPESIDSMLSASALIRQVAQKTGGKITVCYDFILDNPWETEQDIEASIRLCLKLEKPYVPRLFSLTFYPETELYTKARNEGIITDDLNQVYRHSQLTPNPTYLNGVFAVLGADAPKWVATFLLWPYMRRSSPIWFPYLITAAFQVIKFFRWLLAYIVRGDWNSMRVLLHLLPSRVATLQLRVKKGRHTDERPRFCGAPGKSFILAQRKTGSQR